MQKMRTRIQGFYYDSVIRNEKELLFLAFSYVHFDC